jgi:hypothetical protein
MWRESVTGAARLFSQPQWKEAAVPFTARDALFLPPIILGTGSRVRAECVGASPRGQAGGEHAVDDLHEGRLLLPELSYLELEGCSHQVESRGHAACCVRTRQREQGWKQGYAHTHRGDYQPLLCTGHWSTPASQRQPTTQAKEQRKGSASAVASSSRWPSPSAARSTCLWLVRIHAEYARLLKLQLPVLLIPAAGLVRQA